MDSCLSRAMAFGPRINTVHARILSITFDLCDRRSHLVYFNGRSYHQPKGDPNLSIVTQVTLAELAMLIDSGAGGNLLQAL